MLTRRNSLIGFSTSITASVLLLGAAVSGQIAAPLKRDAILNHVNMLIAWYRDATYKVPAAGLPSDVMYEENTRSLAAESVRLGLQSARAAAAVVSEDKNSNAIQQSPAQHPDFTQMAAKISAEIDATQAKLDEVSRQLARGPRGKKDALLAQREKLQGKITLDKAVQDAVQKMAAFAEGNDGTGEGLENNINQLARSVPEVVAGKEAPKPAAKAESSAVPANSSGLVGQAILLIGRVRAMHDIDQMIKQTDRVRQDAEDLRKPLRETLAAVIKRGRDLAGEQDPQRQDVRSEYESLLRQFKQLSSAALPLSQEVLVIEQSRANYVEWRRSTVRDATGVLRTLSVRVAGIALALGIVAILSALWRRLTFRYIHDPRRRRQFLLLRRFVMGFLIGVVLIMGFVSEFSSLATFAGFVTAGIAVGLQALLLSVAAYFFVVGRYGIRVGDRISIAGVTGDVVDIGIVRLYLMELAGVGVDLYPTGRIVVFSNSVLFQAGTPLFKQIPGTEYAWHELAVALSPNNNYKLVQEKISSAVDSVYQQYRERIERQLGRMERQIELQLKSPAPEAKLQLSDNGLEFVMRYPVDIRTASEMDDQVTRAVVELVNSDAALRGAIASSPKIRAAIRG